MNAKNSEHNTNSLRDAFIKEAEEIEKRAEPYQEELSQETKDRMYENIMRRLKETGARMVEEEIPGEDAEESTGTEGAAGVSLSKAKTKKKWYLPHLIFSVNKELRIPRSVILLFKQVLLREVRSVISRPKTNSSWLPPYISGIMQSIKSMN